MRDEGPAEVTADSLIEQLNRDFFAACAQLHCQGTLDVFFLVYLRRFARFGYFSVGPITIDVRLLETLVERTAVATDLPGVTDDYVRFTQLLMEEVRRSGQRRIDELHLLIAFMRAGEGLPGRVFSELGVTIDQVLQAVPGPTGGAPETADRWLTPDQAAEYLQVRVETVRSWIRTGTLPARRVAGLRALRVRFADVAALLHPLDEASRPPQSDP